MQIGIKDCADFVCCWACSPSYSWRCSGYRQDNKAGKMSTSKRRMNRKQWGGLKYLIGGVMPFGIKGCADFVCCWACSPSYSWRRSGYRQDIRAGKMPTCKRKMDRKQRGSLKCLISGVMAGLDLVFKACFKDFSQRFNRCFLYCSSWYFSFYLASFAYPFSGIVHYAPSWGKQNLFG